MDGLVDGIFPVKLLRPGGGVKCRPDVADPTSPIRRRRSDVFRCGGGGGGEEGGRFFRW